MGCIQEKKNQQDNQPTEQHPLKKPPEIYIYIYVYVGYELKK